MAYTAPSELVFPRATTHVAVREFSAEDGGLSLLPIAGVASASMVGGGPSKINQDAFAADACLRDDPNLGLFSVMDGHGPQGHLVARLLAAELAAHAAAEKPSSQSSACPEDGVAPELALRRAFLRQHVAILRASDAIDCSLSGATCSAILIDGASCRAITAHVGDVRCVAAVQRAPRERVRALEWTCDHTPEMHAEASRCHAMGARIAPWREDPRRGGQRPVQRVWLADDDSPGLAVTRAFGDTVGARVGVLAEPTIRSWPCACHPHTRPLHAHAHTRTRAHTRVA